MRGWTFGPTWDLKGRTWDLRGLMFDSKLGTQGVDFRTYTWDLRGWDLLVLITLLYCNLQLKTCRSKCYLCVFLGGSVTVIMAGVSQLHHSYSDQMSGTNLWALHRARNSPAGIEDWYHYKDLVFEYIIHCYIKWMSTLCTVTFTGWVHYALLHETCWQKHGLKSK